MAIRYDISAKIGSYTDKNGEEKGRYVKMGTVMETRNGGLLMKIDCQPLNWDGFAYLNTPKNYNEPAIDRSENSDEPVRPF
jgi:hypothetical protein